MSTFSQLRPRVGSIPIPIPGGLSQAGQNLPVQPAEFRPQKNAVTGALSRIWNGLFGSPYPADNSSAQVVPRSKQFLYQYHEGDLFTPGTQNFVFEYPFELPITTLWGRGFLRTPNTFDPRQPPQVQAQPHITINGIGGLVAGQFAMQPLESDPSSGAI